MDDASGLKNAGAILATFGVTDVAMMDVLSGKFKPQGKVAVCAAQDPQGGTGTENRSARF